MVNVVGKKEIQKLQNQNQHQHQILYQRQIQKLQKIPQQIQHQKQIQKLQIPQQILHQALVIKQVKMREVTIVQVILENQERKENLIKEERNYQLNQNNHLELEEHKKKKYQKPHLG